MRSFLFSLLTVLKIILAIPLSIIVVSAIAIFVGVIAVIVAVGIASIVILIMLYYLAVLLLACFYYVHDRFTKKYGELKCPSKM